VEVEENEKQDIELWLAVNDEGSRATSFDGAADAISTLIAECGGAAVRTVRLLVSMPLPTAVEVEPIEVFEEIDAGEAEASIEEVETAAAA
jgi:hypothetical protein